jgi:hypothetical protein
MHISLTKTYVIDCAKGYHVEFNDPHLAVDFVKQARDNGVDCTLHRVTKHRRTEIIVNYYPEIEDRS